MWPLMAKLATEAKDNPDTRKMRGVRTIVALLIRRLFHKLGITRERV